MRRDLPSPKYTLRSRFLVLGVVTFLGCLCIILIFLPFLNLTLDDAAERTVHTMREAKEVEATTIARLMVLEFSQLKDLLQVEPAVEQEIDVRIKNLLWEKVTFNEIIQGIELIHAPVDAQGQHLTYRFYRRDAPELEPMDGPQKELKKFSGLEKELLDSINANQRVDKPLLDSVNITLKKEGEMLLRYLPVHLLIPEEGAIYWGVAKIGIDTSGMTQILQVQSQEMDYVRNTIFLKIIASVILATLLALSLVYLWARNLTEPLKNLSVVAGELGVETDLNVWLDNLKRVDLKKQTEVDELRQSLISMGTAILGIGQRLLDRERQACWGRVTAGSLPALQDWTAKLQALITGLEASGADDHRTPAPDSRAHDLVQELEDTVTKLYAGFQDLERFLPAPEKQWQTFDLTPGLQSAWRVVTLGLPEGVQLHQEIQALPRVRGYQADLHQAVLYLLDYAAHCLRAEGELTLKARPASSGLVRIEVEFSGPPFSPVECQQLIQPFLVQDGERISPGPALAGAIAAQHGGSFQVVPRKEGGLHFILELPASTD